MQQLKVLSIFGTRAEATKMAPVIQKLNQDPDIQSRVCVTAQHREMLDQVLHIFGIVPDLDLNLMQPNQSLAGLSARIFTELESVLNDEKPDWVLVQGDTTTVAIAAMSAFYQKIKVGHVEAGLRTFDKWQPFPEEINRRLAGIIADLHFAPTEWSRSNLLKEGIEDSKIFVTGNTQVDAVFQIKEKYGKNASEELGKKLGVDFGKRKLVLITAHRRENFGRPLENICEVLKQLANQYADTHCFLYPVHLNPNVRDIVYPALESHPNIHLTEPLGYIELVQALITADIIMTDSGGIQEEATSLKKPALVLRNRTERPEGVEAGILQLVGTDQEKILNAFHKLAMNRDFYRNTVNVPNPYGNGHAAENIINVIKQYQNSH